MTHPEANPNISRRTLARTAAWAAPAVLVATQVPAYAASASVPTTQSRPLIEPVGANEAEAPDLNEIAFTFWFTPPVDEKTGTDLGGSTILKAGAVFTMEIELTYLEGEPVVAPSNWQSGANFTYGPFGSPGVAGSLFNAGNVSATMSEGTVNGQTWHGTATFTTMADITTTGQTSAEGSQIFFPQVPLDIAIPTVDHGFMKLRAESGTFVLQPATGEPTEMALPYRIFLAPIDSQPLPAPEEPEENADAPAQPADAPEEAAEPVVAPAEAEPAAQPEG